MKLYKYLHSKFSKNKKEIGTCFWLLISLVLIFGSVTHSRSEPAIFESIQFFIGVGLLLSFLFYMLVFDWIRNDYKEFRA